jgi:hypothetical protein
MAGIQRKDVFEAADSLVRGGIRPTIERVRVKMGRGSPNTVAPMLDDWFKELGPRISGVTGQNNPGQIAAPNMGLPPSVAQAGNQMWAAACSAAADLVADERQELSSERERLAGESETLSQERTKLAALLELLQSQAAQLTEQLQAARIESAGKDTTIKGLLDDIRAARDTSLAAQAKFDSLQADALAERIRQEERSLANERRLTLEVDRAREAAKTALLAQASAQKEANAQIAALTAESESLALKIRRVAQENASNLAEHNRALQEARNLYQDALAASQAQLQLKDKEFAATVQQLRELTVVAAAGSGTANARGRSARNRNRTIKAV